MKKNRIHIEREICLIFNERGLFTLAQDDYKFHFGKEPKPSINVVTSHHDGDNTSIYTRKQLFDTILHNLMTGRGSSIGSESAWHASGPEFDPHVRHILSWRLGHENISTAILPLPLIQEEQLSVTGERMCTQYW